MHFLAEVDQDGENSSKKFQRHKNEEGVQWGP